MPVITLDRWDQGMDLRKGDSVADANRLRELKNGYITNGWAIQKRPGLRRVLDLSAGSAGLLNHEGKLNTFSSVQNPSHADNNELQMENHVCLNPDDISLDIDRVEYADVFNGFIYAVIRYENGTHKHHWLTKPDKWEASKQYAVGDEVVPTDEDTTPGVHYRVLTAGKSGTGEPTWPPLDPAPRWTPSKTVELNGLIIPTTENESNDTGLYKATVAGDTGLTEPNWPKTSTGTVVDGGVTWTWESSRGSVKDGTVVWIPVTTAIEDQNCPHSASAMKLDSKIYAIDKDITRYSATDNPTDWTTTDDAGFLPTGLRAPGSATALALGSYQGSLVVFMDDSIQIWAVDPDPELNALTEILGNVGTRYPGSVHKVGDDLFFLSDVGFRSIKRMQFHNSLEDLDIGSPIDDAVKENLLHLPDLNIISTYYAGGGQYLCGGEDVMYVFSYSKQSKVNAWSYYRFPYTLEAVEVQGAKMFIRANDIIYHADPEYYTDDGQAFNVHGLMAYQSFKKPGVMKQMLGLDTVMEGSCEIRHRYDARFPDETTGWVHVEDDSRPGPLLPVEVMATEIAFEFENETKAFFRLDQVSYKYEILDVI